MSVAGPLYGPTTGLCQAVYQVSFIYAKKTQNGLIREKSW
jgi:hypothetical protein